MDLSANRTTFGCPARGPAQCWRRAARLDLHPRELQPRERALIHGVGNIPVVLLEDRRGSYRLLPAGVVRGLPGPLAPGCHAGVRLLPRSP